MIKTKAELEQELIDDIAKFELDPLGYVLYAFPWGEGELVGKTGPRRWQRRVLEKLGRDLRSGKLRGWEDVIQKAVASGHGIGKSTLVAWLILWSMSTHEDTRGIVTANTEAQLMTKTWPEVSKWYRRAINAHWFTMTATALFSNQKGHEKTWRIDLIPWSEAKPEAFAGLHNEGKRILLVFDEASAISDIIWETAEGALTDKNTQIMWFAFGNPTRNTGRFRRCFGDLKHRWDGEQIDSRTVEGVNLVQIEKWITDHGEDSDFVRVRVTGKFPRASDMQFISTEVVNAAMRREAQYLATDPLIMALDIARGGSDNCVIRFRRGLDAKSFPVFRIPGSEARDSMRLVSKVVELIEEHKPDAFFYDGTGVGGPIGDRIKQLGYKVIEVQFGADSPDPKQANMRAYIWAKMKEWLGSGGAIPHDLTLEADLTGPEFGHDKKDRLVLESKESMKDRGLASPDDGDALAMTFAFPVAPRDSRGSRNDHVGRIETEYDPFASMHAKAPSPRGRVDTDYNPFGRKQSDTILLSLRENHFPLTLIRDGHRRSESGRIRRRLARGSAPRVRKVLRVKTLPIRGRSLRPRVIGRRHRKSSDFRS